MLTIVKADGKSEKELLKAFESRSGEVDRTVTAQVQEILEQVRLRGDEALDEYTLQFDGALPKPFEITRAALRAAADGCEPSLFAAMEAAAANIREFHEKQRQAGFSYRRADGTILGQRVRGLSRVGIYVPGGTAAYPSSVLMNALPAKIAGVGEIIMVTPPQKGGADPNILAAAYLAGVDRVFLAGGAQGVAALAYGTARIPRVDKIVGPGNIFVATAKRLLYGTVDIDMVAGPSEVLVVADETASPKYVAADLMSQAEHDRLASAILLTTSEKLALETDAELERQAKRLSREAIIREAMKRFGGAIICRDLAEAMALSNAIAPEHLELSVADPEALLEQVENAGSVFLGHSTPEPVGDYFAGPNHVLPTGGTARFFSPLSVDGFYKKTQFLGYSEAALRHNGEQIMAFAQAEGLTAHANSVQVRLEEAQHAAK